MTLLEILPSLRSVMTYRLDPTLWPSETHYSGGRITVGGAPIGGHAFVIVGYTPEGFIIRNSWGDKWGRWDGRPGHAIWTYADWANNVIDAWVVRLSASTPAG